METLAKHVANMVQSYIYCTKDLSEEYTFDNGTKMVVSRNHMIGGGRHGYVGALPYDKAGNQVDERAEAWLTATEVAEKMMELSEE